MGNLFEKRLEIIGVSIYVCDTGETYDGCL